MELPRPHMLSAGSCQTSPGGSYAAVPLPEVRRYYSVNWSSRCLCCRIRTAMFVSVLCYVATVLVYLVQRHGGLPSPVP